MAARRLIIVMLVLLGVSTAIAIVAPDPVEQTAETGQTGTTGATGETGDVARGTTGATGGTPGATGTNGPGGGADGGSESGNDRPGNDGDGKPDEVELSNEGRTVSITTTVGGDQVLICVRPDSRLILNLRTNRRGRHLDPEVRPHRDGERIHAGGIRPAAAGRAGWLRRGGAG